MDSRKTVDAPSLKGLAEQAARAALEARLNDQAALSRMGSRRTGRSALLVVGALAVLGIAWGAYTHWRQDSRPLAAAPAGAGVKPERLAAASGPFHGQPVERMPLRSGASVSQPANTGAPDPPAVTDELQAPCLDPASEQAVLQALDEPNDEARYLRLQDTLGSGAEIPLDRMREVLVTDPSDKVRELALTALTQHPDASVEEIRAVAEDALANESLAVRAYAARILEQMDELERIDSESREMQRAM